MKKHNIVLGITGASGAIYGKILLDCLGRMPDQVASCGVIFSSNAKAVWRYELNDDPDLVHNGGSDGVRLNTYAHDDLFAPMASGSAGYDTMIICPCTMGTMGRIAAGISSDLLARAADVMLKERKKLILVPRETPYNLIHLNNMKLLTEAGALICPASPSFYSKPSTIDELVMTVVERILKLAGLEFPGYQWGN